MSQKTPVLRAQGVPDVWVTRRLKSADLFVARYRKALNLPRRGVITPASVPLGGAMKSAVYRYFDV